LNKPYAVLKNRDFYFAGILPYHVEDELKKLIIRGVVKWNSKLGIFWIIETLMSGLIRSKR